MPSLRNLQEDEKRKSIDFIRKKYILNIVNKIMNGSYILAERE
jgi:hypothetical protein